MLRRLAAAALISATLPAGLLVASATTGTATATAAGSAVRTFLADFESAGDATRANSSFWQAEMGTNVYNPDWKNHGGASAVPQSGAMSVRVQSDADGVPCYSGNRCLRLEASAYDGFARVLARADWPLDQDVWWGGAFMLPRGYYGWMPSGSSPAAFRWENYDAYKADKDNGGFHIWGWDADHRFRLTYWRQNPPEGQPRNYHLAGPLEIPEGRWVWVDVRQRFSYDPSKRVNEVWIHDRLVASCNGATCPENYDYSRPFKIDYMRWGALTWLAQKHYLFYDRIYFGPTRLGSLGSGDGGTTTTTTGTTTTATTTTATTTTTPPTTTTTTTTPPTTTTTTTTPPTTTTTTTTTTPAPRGARKPRKPVRSLASVRVGDRNVSSVHELSRVLRRNGRSLELFLRSHHRVAVAFGVPGVRWDGRRFYTRGALAPWLRARGSAYRGWAAKHPAAVRRIYRGP